MVPECRHCQTGEDELFKAVSHKGSVWEKVTAPSTVTVSALQTQSQRITGDLGVQIHRCLHNLLMSNAVKAYLKDEILLSNKLLLHTTVWMDLKGIIVSKEEKGHLRNYITILFHLYSICKMTKSQRQRIDKLFSGIIKGEVVCFCKEQSKGVLLW